MASLSRCLIASILLFILILSSVSAQIESLDCGVACSTRCSLSGRPNLCKRACGTCCAKCNCVPPGTNGNYEACPCYANLTTHGDQRKCP